MGKPQDRHDGAPRRALVVGRFQPPHHGHLHCLKEAADGVDSIVVVIGSAQRSHTPENPLTAGERVELLSGLAKDEGIPVEHVIPVPDLDQYHLWVSHVEGYVPSFDRVVGANPLTLHLFEQAGYPVHRVETQKRDRWSGTEIRRRLYAGEDPAQLLPDRVARFLKTEPLQSRFQALAKRQGPRTG